MKMKVLLFFIFNVFIFAVFADTKDVSMSKNFKGLQSKSLSLNERITELEKKPITPPVGSCAEKGYGVYFIGEPLFWRFAEEGLEYAITGSFNLLSQGITSYRLVLNNGKTHEPDFDWDLGFRLGLGYNFSYDGWDLYSSYTRFHDKVKDSIKKDGDPNVIDYLVSGGTGEYISPFWVAQLFAPPGLMNYAKARWNLKIDLIDLNLGRNFFISRFLTLKPYIGLKNGWIGQKYYLNFIKYYYPTDPSQIEREINIKMKNDFWGIGGNFGLNTSWILGRGVSLFGNGVFSILEGKFHLRYRLDDFKPVTTYTFGSIVADEYPPHEDVYVTIKEIHTFVTMANFSLGLRFDKSYANDSFCLGIKLGYEYNIFFGQNRFMNHQYDFTFGSVVGPQSPNGPNFFTDRGNLTSSGATGTLEFNF